MLSFTLDMYKYCQLIDTNMGMSGHKFPELGKHIYWRPWLWQNKSSTAYKFIRFDVGFPRNNNIKQKYQFR